MRKVPRDRIEDFAVKTGFRLKNIYIVTRLKTKYKEQRPLQDSGRKKIVLYDTLLKEFPEEEIVAVLAHEIGHLKETCLINLLFSVMLTGFMLFLFSLVVDNPALSQAWGKESSFHLGLVVFGILYSPLSLLIGLITNIISRENEFAADQFVKENYNGKILGDALKKLSVKNLSNMMPHPLYVFFHYSHPPLLQRLEKLE